MNLLCRTGKPVPTFPGKAGQQGNVLALANQDGTLAQQFFYTPFGVELVGNAGENPFRYTGRRFDPETDLYYYRARYYDADLGRFLQVDPVGYADQWNLYAYVGNNPLNATDPTGEAGEYGPGDIGCTHHGCDPNLEGGAWDAARAFTESLFTTISKPLELANLLPGVSVSATQPTPTRRVEVGAIRAGQAVGSVADMAVGGRGARPIITRATPAAARWGTLTLARAIIFARSSGRGKIVLGHFPDYVNVARALQSRKIRYGL